MCHRSRLTPLNIFPLITALSLCLGLSSCPETPKKTRASQKSEILVEATPEPSKRPAVFLGGLHEPSPTPSLEATLLPTNEPEASESPQDDKNWRYLIKDRVRIRREPNLEASIIVEASLGQKLELLEGKKESELITWHQVGWGNQKGWVSGEFLGTKDPTAPTVQTAEPTPPPASLKPTSSPAQKGKTKNKGLPTPLPVKETPPPLPKPVTKKPTPDTQKRVFQAAHAIMGTLLKNMNQQSAWVKVPASPSHLIQKQELVYSKHPHYVVKMEVDLNRLSGGALKFAGIFMPCLTLTPENYTYAKSLLNPIGGLKGQLPSDQDIKAHIYTCQKEFFKIT